MNTKPERTWSMCYSSLIWWPWTLPSDRIQPCISWLP